MQKQISKFSCLVQFCLIFLLFANCFVTNCRSTDNNVDKDMQEVTDEQGVANTSKEFFSNAVTNL